MAERTIKEILDAGFPPLKGESVSMWEALREAREVLREVAYMYKADRGARRLLKKWDTHE